MNWCYILQLATVTFRCRIFKDTIILVKFQGDKFNFRLT